VVAVAPWLLASDQPLVLHVGGETSLVADGPRGERGAELSAVLQDGDWALWPPLRHSDRSIRSSGQLRVLAAPSAEHALGTDDRGRDVLARLLYGARTTLSIAAAATAVALSLGVLLAILALRVRRFGELALLTVADAISAVPAILWVVAAAGLFGISSLTALILLIALPRCAGILRLAHAEMRVALASPFCAAARGLGASPMRLLLRHALPQARDQLVAAAVITATTAVLAEAALGYLGFGAPPPTASWGELLAQAQHNDFQWWLAVPAGAMIALTAVALDVLARASSRTGKH